MTEVEKYIEGFPTETQEILSNIHRLVLSLSPQATESISYGMPAYKLNKKPLIYFAGYKSHIGLYATPAGHAEFAKELAKYKQGKGSVQFQLNEPIPYELIKRIILFRISQNIK